MKERHISWLIYGVLAVACAFALGWVLGSGGVRETVAVTVSEPAQASQAPSPDETGNGTDSDAPADSDSGQEAALSPELPAPEEPTADHPLDLNAATQAELELLPGIGPALAQAILDYRAEFGPFTAPEQLMEVPGIGEKRYAAVEQLIDVEETP